MQQCTKSIMARCTRYIAKPTKNTTILLLLLNFDFYLCSASSCLLSVKFFTISIHIAISSSLTFCSSPASALSQSQCVYIVFIFCLVHTFCPSRIFIQCFFSLLKCCYCLRLILLPSSEALIIVYAQAHITFHFNRFHKYKHHTLIHSFTLK